MSDHDDEYTQSDATRLFNISAKGVNALRLHQNKVALEALKDARDYIVGSQPLQITNDVVVRIDKAIEALEP